MQHSGKQVALGKEKAEVFRRYHALMQRPREVAAPTDSFLAVCVTFSNGRSGAGLRRPRLVPQATAVFCDFAAIDGRRSAVGEMQLQSHLGYKHFLPATPAAWTNGSIQGLKARGGFVIDFTWRDGALAEGVIRSDLGQPCRIYSKEPLAVRSDSQEVATKREGDVVSFATEPGATYEIRYEQP